MDLKNLGKSQKKTAVYAIVAIALSLVLLRISGFSASTVVNLQNYIVKSMILGTSGMTTLAAIYSLAAPFLPVFLAMIIFVLALSILSAYGYDEDNSDVGKLAGLLGGVFAIVLFPTIWGAFFAVSIYVCCFYSVQFSNTYRKELKRWVHFRTGSNTLGKMLFIMNIIVSIGLFIAVLYSQPAYAESFRSQLTDSMRSIAVSLPGASSIPSDVLNQRIGSVIASSTLFTAYIRWLPVSIAFSAWVMLEVLRNVIFSNAGGLFTYLILRRNER